VKGKVLITGSSGLIGKSLARLLKERGYQVGGLSRHKPPTGNEELYHWDPNKKFIDSAALKDVTHIIHLAGAGIADKRWTGKRKKEIIGSRVGTARLLYDYVIREGTGVRCFISASGIGYYGAVTGERIFTEDDSAGSDFAAETSVLWEEAADLFKSSGIRTVKVRTAIVLARNGGFIRRILPLARAGIAIWFGDGRQYFPWIHIDDLCNIYLKAIEDETMEGPYNAVAPQSVTQAEFMKRTADKAGKPALKAGIPTFIIKMALGEMSSLLLNGSRVSSSAIETAGYCFKYSSSDSALDQILKY
jgi:uncharacterized protein